MVSQLEQTANEFIRLFFYEMDCAERKDQVEAKRISERKDSLLKELKANGYNVGALIEELKIKKAFQKEFNTVIVFMDGGVRNNHDVSQVSTAASAFVVYGDKKMITHNSNYIGSEIKLPNGEKTEINSTLAEYHGLHKALDFIEKHSVKAERIIFLTDCASMVRHILGKTPQHPIFHEYASLLKNKFNSFQNVELKHIPREHNKIADKLVNQLLDIQERSEQYDIN